MAESSIGVQVRYSTDGGSNYTSAGCLTEADISGQMKETGEGQCLSQTSGRWKSFFGKFADAGEGTFTLDWDKEDYEAVFDMVPDEDPILWQFVIPDGSDLTDPTTCSRWACNGLVTRLGIAFPSDGDRVTAPVTLKFSGAPTFTAAP